MTREQLYHLVDELPETELQTAGRFLAYLRDLEGEEPFSSAELDAIRESQEQAQRGELIGFAEVVATLDPDFKLAQ